MRGLILAAASVAALGASAAGVLWQQQQQPSSGEIRVSPMDAGTLEVTLSAPSQTANVTEGATNVSIGFDATMTPAPGFSKPIYPDVQFNAAHLTQVGGLDTGTPGTWHAAFTTPSDLPGGATSGTITFRLCRDTPCTRVYPGTEKSFAYTVNNTLGDWVTYQRNAGHTAYVAARYNGIIKKRWIWQPTGTDLLTEVATKGSAIFVTQITGGSTQTATVTSLDALGAVRWSHPIGSASATGAPAVAGDKVVVFSRNQDSIDLPVIALNEADGTPSGLNMRFDAKPGIFQAPTPYGGSLYAAVGYNEGEVDAYNLTTGAKTWVAGALGSDITNGETPAVDENYVYYFTGTNLNVYDRLTGTLAHQIHNVFFDSIGPSYYGGPMLGTGGNTILYLGTGAPRLPRMLANYSTTLGRPLWGKPNYSSQPAFANGVVYAAQRNRFDAIDETTGNILWSWTPPSGEILQYNTLITDSIAFVSSDTRLYAISLTDPAHGMIWSAFTPGYTAISKDNLLLVSTVIGGKPTLVGYSLS